MDEKNRVLQLNLDGTGGAFSIIYQMQKHLSNEFIFDFYWMGEFKKTNKSEELKKLGCQIYSDTLRKNRLIGHILLPFRFYGFLKKHQYKIIHVNADLAYKMFIYAIPARIAGVEKIILHSHSSSVNGDFKGLKIFMHKVCRPFIQSKRYIHLTCSRLASEWMFSRKKDDNVIMINNGVDLKHFIYNSDIRKKIRNNLNIENYVVLGTVGNLSYAKNPELLIDIFYNLKNKDKYRLLFVGDGANRQEVEMYAKNRGVYECCVFLGNSEDVSQLLNAMDIYIMTSRFEGLPVSAVEAQANGLPCILSESITKETKMLDTCRFISINESLDVWVKAIETQQFESNRKRAYSIMKNKGFDIDDSANVLRKVYHM